MAETPESVLVYDRIDENRQNTRLLMVAFIVLLLPLAGGVAQYLTPHSLFLRPIHPADVEPTTYEILSELWAAVLVLLAIGTGTLIFVAHFSSSLLLQHVDAHRVMRWDQSALWNTVENLCIGAGLPMPALYIVQSDVANAFAIGRDPKQASLIVTSGLLSLLKPRELTAVIAHELSHIGNYDTSLNTMLAAIVATLRVPWNVCVTILRLGSRMAKYLNEANGNRQGRAGVGILLYIVNLAGPTLFVMVSAFITVSLTVVNGDISTPARIWRFLSIAALPYALFGAPYLATSLRRMISQEREFLADADAVLLTRDPDGLALALAKVGRAGWGGKAGAATAHLYFVDPLPAARSWWDSLYQLHPPVSERIGRIATMGDGISVDELKAAEAIGRDYGEKLYRKESLLQLPAHLRPMESPESPEAPQPLVALIGENGVCRSASFRLTHDVTALYEKPDGWSRIIKQLPEGSIVTPDGHEGNFVRVATSSGSGYLAQGTLAVATQTSGNTAPSLAASRVPSAVAPYKRDQIA